MACLHVCCAHQDIELCSCCSNGGCRKRHLARSLTRELKDTPASAGLRIQLSSIDTTCMKIRGSVVTWSCCFPILRRMQEKKKKLRRTLRRTSKSRPSSVAVLWAFNVAELARLFEILPSASLSRVGNRKPHIFVSFKHPVPRSTAAVSHRPSSSELCGNHGTTTARQGVCFVTATNVVSVGVYKYGWMDVQGAPLRGRHSPPATLAQECKIKQILWSGQTLAIDGRC